MQEARNSMANFPQEGGSKDLKLLSLFSKHGIDMHINQVQLNKCETAPNFIQLNQNLTSDWLLI